MPIEIETILHLEPVEWLKDLEVSLDSADQEGDCRTNQRDPLNAYLVTDEVDAIEKVDHRPLALTLSSLTPKALPKATTQSSEVRRRNLVVTHTPLLARWCSTLSKCSIMLKKHLSALARLQVRTIE